MARKSLNDPWDSGARNDPEEEFAYTGEIDSDLEELRALLSEINRRKTDVAENKFSKVLQLDDSNYRVIEGVDEFEDYAGQSDGAFAMQRQNDEDAHRRELENLRAAHERTTASKVFEHNKSVNWYLIGFILALFGVSVAVLGYIAITNNAPHQLESKKEAIAALGPLIGLGLGFATGKVKWPSL